MMRFGVHSVMAMHEPSQVGEGRRASVECARALGFDEVAVGRVALAATEMGNNLVRHARGGQLWWAAVRGEAGQSLLELLSVDDGPGIANVAQCMADGYSTGGTPGTGLGALKRLADEFDIYSAPPGGTVVLARIGARARGEAPSPPSGFRIGGVALPALGESVWGDDWTFAQDGERAAVLVADGLGHGPGAAEASGAAVALFEGDPHAEPGALLERVHQALRTTRGAAVAVATLDGQDGGIVFCGVGNIAARLVSGVSDRSLLSQHGTAGVQIRRLQPQRYDWPDHGRLVLHSDGIVSRWTLPRGDLLQRHPSVIAAVVMQVGRRGADDATVVVVERRGER